MSAPLPSLELAKPGTRCPRCGQEIELEDYCSHCEWTIPEGAILAAAILADLPDVEQGRTPLRLGYRMCMGCGREVVNRDGGHCATCDGDGTTDEDVRAANMRAGAKARAEQDARGRLDFLRGEKWAAKR